MTYLVQIMGSAFIGYGIIYAVLLHIGAQSIIARGGSQEFVDSTVIMLWGIVNTFTEHHGGPWTHKDLQHTMLGVLWWCGGALGMFMSRKGTRSIIPAGIIIMTGYVMSAHAQAMEISTKVCKGVISTRCLRFRTRSTLYLDTRS